MRLSLFSVLFFSLPLAIACTSTKAAGPCDGTDFQACYKHAESLVKKDGSGTQEAAPLFEKACDGGVAEACNALASIYFMGMHGI